MADETVRGGSISLLPQADRAELHVRYDKLHALAKQIKRAHREQFKKYQRERGARGYTLKLWQQNWRDYVMKHYSGVEDFAMIFASIESPSASDAAYQTLAEQTGHKRSYIETLVIKARKTNPRD